MTSSTDCRGLIFFGSPPIFAMASRIAARSTTHGTPVKSCSNTRLGVKAISLSGSLEGSQRARASMSSLRTETPSSVRSRFSKRILSENGRRLASGRIFSTAASRKTVYSWPPTVSVPWLPKLFDMLFHPVQGELPPLYCYCVGSVKRGNRRAAFRPAHNSHRAAGKTFQQIRRRLVSLLPNEVRAKQELKLFVNWQARIG